MKLPEKGKDMGFLKIAGNEWLNGSYFPLVRGTIYAA